MIDTVFVIFIIKVGAVTQIGATAEYFHCERLTTPTLTQNTHIFNTVTTQHSLTQINKKHIDRNNSYKYIL